MGILGLQAKEDHALQIEHLQEIIEQAIIDQAIIEHLQVIGQHLRSHITGPPPLDRWDHHLVLTVVEVVHIAVVQAEVVQVEVVVEDDKILLKHKLTKKEAISNEMASFFKIALYL